MKDRKHSFAPYSFYDYSDFYSNEWILAYNGAVVWLEPGGEPTQEQMDTIAARLGVSD